MTFTSSNAHFGEDPLSVKIVILGPWHVHIESRSRQFHGVITHSSAGIEIKGNVDKSTSFAGLMVCPRGRLDSGWRRDLRGCDSEVTVKRAE